MAGAEIPRGEVPTNYSALPPDTVPKWPVPRDHPKVPKRPVPRYHAKRFLGTIQPNLWIQCLNGPCRGTTLRFLNGRCRGTARKGSDELFSPTSGYSASIARAEGPP